MEGRNDSIKLLMGEGTDVNQEEYVCECRKDNDEYRDTPLIEAAKNNQMSTVSYYSMLEWISIPQMVEEKQP